MKQSIFTKVATIRFTPAQYDLFRQFAFDNGYSGVAQLLRDCTVSHISAIERQREGRDTL
jgi:predicted secreted protein